jgi:hypothetical protein
MDDFFSVIKKLKWWQALIYLAIVIVPNLGNIADFHQSVVLDIPYDAVPLAMEQNTLWTKNCDCVQSTTDVLVVTTPSNVEVKFLICPNGDGLVQTKQPDGKTYARWVSPSSFQGKGPYCAVTTWLGLSTAVAMEPQQQHIRIVCQWDDPLYRYVVYQDPSTEKCYIKKINRYTGRVMVNEEHACNCDYRG